MRSIPHGQGTFEGNLCRSVVTYLWMTDYIVNCSPAQRRRRTSGFAVTMANPVYTAKVGGQRRCAPLPLPPLPKNTWDSCIVYAGIDVTANQDDELSDKETFQMEFDAKKDQWRVRTADNAYWKVADASGIQATDDGRSVLVSPIGPVSK